MFIGIKVTGIKNWLWFEPDKVTEQDGVFQGKAGWGIRRGFIKEMTIPSSMIQARISSITMQEDADCSTD